MRSRRFATSSSSTSSTFLATAMTCRRSKAGRGDTEPWLSAPARRRPTRSEPATPGTEHTRLAAAIFDVDGVLVASPHERAWREALEGFGDPGRFTTEFYQSRVAGKPRLDGARATLEGLGVPDAAAKVGEYARKKQALIDRLIA